MSVTIAVDPVQPASTPASDQPMPDVFQRVIGQPLVTCTDVDARLVTPTPVHPLAAAVQLAFTQHRPLILSPDTIWLAIAQGFSQHVNQNPELLRGRLVRHQGVKTLQLPVPNLTTHQDWAEAIDGLCGLLSDEVDPGLAKSLRCDFSTTTPVARVASDVVLLEAFQRYFVYEFLCICGIPEVTLLGTAEDWRKIEARVETLGQYDLRWWTDQLVPVCRELRKTVEGDPDLDFWQSIYMPEEVYGGEDVTGWIVRFFPYAEAPGGEFEETELRRSVMRRNEALNEWKVPSSRAIFRRRAVEVTPGRRQWLCQGMRLKHLPLGLSRVPVRVAGPTGDVHSELQLLAGFVGVSQTSSLAVQPHIGWGVVAGIEEKPRVEFY